jgi:hypothetical protein
VGVRLHAFFCGVAERGWYSVNELLEPVFGLGFSFDVFRGWSLLMVAPADCKEAAP